MLGMLLPGLATSIAEAVRMGGRSDADENDEELIRRVIAREPGADEQFLSRHRGLVLGLTRGKYRMGLEEAQEVLDATVVRLWDKDFRALRGWRKEARFSTYLGSIVVSVCRELRARPGDGQPLELTSETDPGPSPLAIVLCAEQRKGVVDTMKELSARDRLILTLVFFDERPLRNVGALPNLKPGAVRKALYDAKKRFHAALLRTKPEIFSGKK